MLLLLLLFGAQSVDAVASWRPAADRSEHANGRKNNDFNSANGQFYLFIHIK